jgi:uncharacterized protein YecT (DUF1311 family)
MRLSRLLLTAALVANGALPASAENSEAKDAAVINNCLTALDKRAAGQEVQEATCLLKIADPCIGNDAGAVSDAKQITCLDRERGVWDRILNDSYKTMLSGLDSAQSKKLREMQRAWIRARDLTCTFWYDYFDGSMARPMIASCNNRETARRAIYLRTFAVDISERK